MRCAIRRVVGMPDAQHRFMLILMHTLTRKMRINVRRIYVACDSYCSYVCSTLSRDGQQAKLKVRNTRWKYVCVCVYERRDATAVCSIVVPRITQHTIRQYGHVLRLALARPNYCASIAVCANVSGSHGDDTNDEQSAILNSCTNGVDAMEKKFDVGGPSISMWPARYLNADLLRPTIPLFTYYIEII